MSTKIIRGPAAKPRSFHQTDPLEKHPPEYREDLNPNPLAGQNIGAASARPEELGIHAWDIKQAHGLFPDLDADELKRLRVLPAGARLQTNATYLDLRDRASGEIIGRSGMVAREGQWLVAKSDVDYELWNKLRGGAAENPRRTGTEG